MNKFYSKILLFGEYGIIKGSKGFALPFDVFEGELKFDPKSSDKSNLNTLGEHIKRSRILKKEMNVDQLIKDISEGLIFFSNIPQGYGLGSSGALTAALFCKYSINYLRDREYDVEEIAYIQELLSIIESYFHGTSSGLDPLISFFNKPLIVSGKQEVEFVQMPNFELLGQFYLLDTQSQRKTSPLVHQFLKDYSDEKYAQGINKFMSLNDELISNTIVHDKANFLDNFRELSRIQYLYFDKMIPGSIKEIWLDGLENKNYFLKLCGAGGGGFFIVYSPEGKVPLSHTLIKFS